MAVLEGASKVAENLYISGIAVARDSRALKSAGIGSVVSCLAAGVDLEPELKRDCTAAGIRHFHVVRIAKPAASIPLHAVASNIRCLLSCEQHLQYTSRTCAIVSNCAIGRARSPCGCAEADWTGSRSQQIHHGGAERRRECSASPLRLRPVSVRCFTGRLPSLL